MRQILFGALSIAGLVVALFISPTASAQVANDHLIIPGERVGPISLGMSTQDLYKALGEPTQSVTGNDGTWASYSWQDLTVQTDLPSGKVSHISVSGPSYSIDNNLRVGASELALRANLPNPQSTTAQTPESKLFCYAAGLAVRARADPNYSEKIESMTVRSPGCSATGSYVCFHFEGGVTHLDRKCTREN